MESPTGFIPDPLMDVTRRADALRFLEAQPIPGKLKVGYWQGWCMWVGAKWRKSDFDRLIASGADA